ncbi:hypothetical protein [Mycolicibacterium baixiangningiae]|uniref:hypothetical protein n=1 Tax=Mycolicibacterium baixiangningiae TaxID=2761578 RepID=UPI0018666B9D|nr:hypothetical protein [Mycolicibacterium baixiangningiae]
MTRLRVVQWGTGAVGTEILATILDHRPDLELVGVKVYSETKNHTDVEAIPAQQDQEIAAEPGSPPWPPCR